MTRLLACLPALALLAAPAAAQPPAVPPAQPPKFEDFDKVVAGAKTYDGLIKLYQKDDHLFAELQPHQLDHPYLCAISLARGGMDQAGWILNFEEQWVVAFKRVGDKVHLIRKNVRYKGGSGPLAAPWRPPTPTPSCMALPVKSVHPIRQSVLIDFNQVFFSNFADLPFGLLDRDRTAWHKVKTFPKNVELQVGRRVREQGRPGLGHRPAGQHGHRPLRAGRAARPRLPAARCRRPGRLLPVRRQGLRQRQQGHAFVRYVNRWRLERADGSPWKEGAKLVPPKKKIVFWIEKSVPDEYRAAVREGILEWNKAFEKIGFRDAIEVRQQEGEDFDPEDVTYSTFRWITTDIGYAMGPSRANPYTGEIIDADIIFDASMVRFYKRDQQLYKTDAGYTTEPDSPIQAARHGWSSRGTRPLRAGELERQGRTTRTRPSGTGSRRTGPGCASAPRTSRPSSAWRLAALAARRRPEAGRQAVRRDDPAGRQGDRDARGRAHARPAAQLQGEHDAQERPAPRPRRHPQAGAGRQRDGLQPGEPGPEGGQAGRLLHHDHRAVRLLGHRVRVQADRRRDRRREGGTGQDRRPRRRDRARVRAPTRTYGRPTR